LLRHDSRSTGRAHGGPAPLRGLSAVVCPTPAHHIVFHAYGGAVSEHRDRRQRRDHERREHVTAWQWSPVVEALQALREVHLIAAVTLVAERGALTRFESPRELLKVLGLLPSE